MTVQEAMQQRRSIRRFTQDPVSPEDIDTLLHAAMSGPSAVNRRPWDFYVISNPDVLQALRSSSHFTHITSPLAIVVCGNLSRTLPLQGAQFWIQDCSAATENILLQATELGLGAVWCGIHPGKKAKDHVSQVLGLKDKNVPLNIIFIGHPAENPKARDQYEDKCVHYVR